MRTISNNSLSIPTFSVDDIRDDSMTLENKSIIENLVKNMVLVENGIYLQNIYDVKTFRGNLVSYADPKATEVDSFYISKYPVTQKEWTFIIAHLQKYIKR